MPERTGWPTSEHSLDVAYARGITLTLANDVVGTGPRLQMLNADDAANRFVEA